MNHKKLLFVAIATLLLISTVSAVEITNNATVRVNGIDAATYVVTSGVPTTAYQNSAGVVAGEKITVKVYFTANLTGIAGATSASDVKVRAEIEGEKVDMEEVTESFDIEQGRTYVKTLDITVPSELKNKKSDDFILNVKIWNANFKSEIENIVLRAQRPSYSVDIKSITAGKTVQAGEILPVEIVLKNVGYNDLEDIYVSAKISALNIERNSYFGDLVAIETSDDEDAVKGTLNLRIPYETEGGTYTLELDIRSDDATANEAVTIEVKNEFSNRVFVSGNSLWIVNPTNTIAGYRIIPESPATVTENVVFVPAGSSRTINIDPNTNQAYEADVNIFTIDGKLVETVVLSGQGEESKAVSPVAALTVVLGIIFLALLVFLIVLVTKKPQKAEEIGESYY